MGRNSVNTLIEEKWVWIAGVHAMRSGLIENLSDADLAFNPGGQNSSLGALFREIGQIEQSYIDSFKDFKQDFLYRHPDPMLGTSVTQLNVWFQSMDNAFKDTLSTITEANAHKSIQRPARNAVTLSLQVDIYIQAMMIFFGKAIIYYRAMDKPLPHSIQAYIA